MNGSNISIGGSRIVKGDIKASNGRIHVVDASVQPRKVVRRLMQSKKLYLFSEIYNLTLGMAVKNDG